MSKTSNNNKKTLSSTNNNPPSSQTEFLHSQSNTKTLTLKTLQCRTDGSKAPDGIEFSDLEHPEEHPNRNSGQINTRQTVADAVIIINYASQPKSASQPSSQPASRVPVWHASSTPWINHNCEQANPFLAVVLKEKLGASLARN